MIGPQGIGTQNDPRKIAVLVTDGLETSQSSFSSMTIRQQDCELISQTNGVDLFVLNVNYPNPDYLDIRAYRVDFLVEDLAPALKACAGNDNRYFEATQGAEIAASFTEIANTIMKTTKVRLTH